MTERTAIFISMLLFAALGMLMADGLVQDCPDPSVLMVAGVDR